MKPLVLMRGGGDIASGAVYRLKRAGYPVVINEIAIPTMIRREVCYGNAVHRGEMILERYVARHVSIEEIPEMLANDVIPVVTSSYEDLLATLHPSIVVDAILSKKNLGTNKSDAELVVGVGPGFTAGYDVDVVIETMRGHWLGRCIYDGPAQPNTGIPGDVGGFTHERVIHAPKAGLFTAKRHIGDSVQANEVIGYVDDEPVRAKITGILRGILKSGLIVSDHFKLADVDARCEESHCYSISDKSLAVGGGVLEAVTAWDYERNQDGNDL
ncbi:selenium-dependent molybdenum cofactor biosynthesis protein YqeB [Veillonella rodentium]|uniref:Selenium-dependent molybdenum hydroxylase system protein, YqeB family n=1 Tax=Veillonella rodentium TaxID=248315 RepID=A0A239YH43_9FIRM|nr:selenium-dependent molybdenum cofactor biosynthesis protein YqeB [Veillonella rodentium]SNV57713.1 selenium-dependent molybdenum hydroxylase system protein, YqeB family [Veillonella rodentium]